MGQGREQQGGGSWLEKKLAALDALYRRFGREGLKDQPIADVSLLLSSKELQLRDAAKSPDLGEDQKAANRQLPFAKHPRPPATFHPFQPNRMVVGSPLA